MWQFEDFESFTGPDEKRFPEFTAERRREMLDEVHNALNRVFLDDQPLSRLLDEDCLATKPLFLTKTALPLRTSPVQRGAWVVETLIGRRIPPPPPNVPKLSDDEKSSEGLNIQQQLAKHREIASCASCHKKIDPLGFALENFDVIGGWRENYRALKEPKPSQRAKLSDGPAVQSADEWHGVGPFATFQAFRDLVKTREHLVAENLAHQLATFALGRPPGFADREPLKTLATQAREKKTGMKTLVLDFIGSVVFVGP